MPRGDYRKRETKKPKKDKRKTNPLTSLIAPQPEPQRVRRERKPREEEDA